MTGSFCIVHALEGRLRMRLPKIKRASREALEVELRLEQIMGIEYVSANPATGNVLIHYDPNVIKQEEVISSLMELGFAPQPMDGNGGIASPTTLERVASSMATTIMEAALIRLVGALI